MSAPEKIWAFQHWVEFAMPGPAEGVPIGQWKACRFLDAVEYIRADLARALPSADYAAGLDAAARYHDDMAAKLQAIGDEYPHGFAAEYRHSIESHKRSAAAIRALITPAQHDALAAHVAAEVAKARAEWVKDAKERIEGLFLTTKIKTTYSNSYDLHADWHNRGLRSALAQIGAKP